VSTKSGVCDSCTLTNPYALRQEFLLIPAMREFEGTASQRLD